MFPSMIATASSLNGIGDTSSSSDTLSSRGLSGTDPKIAWLPTINSSLQEVAAPHARIMCSNSCRFIEPIEHPSPFSFAQDIRKRTRLTQARRFLSRICQQFEDLAHRLLIKYIEPFPQGAFYRFRITLRPDSLFKALSHFHQKRRILLNLHCNLPMQCQAALFYFSVIHNRFSFQYSHNHPSHSNLPFLTPETAGSPLSRPRAELTRCVVRRLYPIARARLPVSRAPNRFSQPSVVASFPCFL